MNAAERRRDAFVHLPEPTFTFRVFPCERCENCYCPCVRGDIEIRRATAAVALRHRQSVARAKRSQQRRAA